MSREKLHTYDAWELTLLLIIIYLAVFNEEHDIGTYTIKAVDDPRSLNKVLYIKPPKNIYSFNELVALWEKKIGHPLEKEYIPEELLLKQIQGTLCSSDTNP